MQKLFVKLLSAALIVTLVGTSITPAFASPQTPPEESTAITVIEDAEHTSWYTDGARSNYVGYTYREYHWDI